MIDLRLPDYRNDCEIEKGILVHKCWITRFNCMYTLVSLQASMMYLSCEVNEYSLYIVVCMFPLQFFPCYVN